MIKKLVVKNFAIIEDISLDFMGGMTAITGETGAGKSLLIDTIDLLLGARADTDMIRYGTDNAYILGVFSNEDEVSLLLEKNNIPQLDEIRVERIISSSKSQIKINNTSVSLTILKTIGKYLADLHIQNDTYKLFNPETYLNLLDPKMDNKFNKLVNDYTKYLFEYQNAIKKYEHIINSKNKTLERLEFLEFEHEELNNLDLSVDIDKILEEEIEKLDNFDKISTNLNEAYELIENNNSPLDNIYNASKLLDKIKSYSKEYEEYYDKMIDSYYILDEIRMNLSKEINNLDFDIDEFNLKQEKLNEINKAKEKYKMSVNELIEYNNKIDLEIKMATNYDELIKEIDDEVKNKFDNLKQKALDISNYRKKIAKELEKGIMKECMELDLENTIFKVEFKDIILDNPFDKSIFKENGIDEINFMITFNKGEPLKPLYKVASGGEASRLMLSFKSYFSEKNDAKLIVFDEIDSGVSGKTAMKIAKKMQEIAKNIQVLAITHLASVAASADQQMFISKEEINGRTKTNIKLLSMDERIKEIAQMLSGDIVTVYALEHAKELLKK